jgi:hypothetical protein
MFYSYTQVEWFRVPPPRPLISEEFYPLADFSFFMLKISDFFIKTQRAYSTEKATKARSDPIILGILGTFPIYLGWVIGTQ